MAQLFKIGLWNVNEILNCKHEMEAFMTLNNTANLWVTFAIFIQLQNTALLFYNAVHPDTDRKKQAGAAILVWHSIQYRLCKIETSHLQAVNIEVVDWFGPLTISAVYCPPNYPPNKVFFLNYFTELGNSFLTGGDINAKHMSWGYRLLPPGRGRLLYQVIQELELGIS